jgi:hypothetical protein
MTSKTIAIIGSVDATRTDYYPPLINVAEAPDAGRALGDALAKSGYQILVFSSSPSFIEAYIVEGYVKSGKAREKSIIMLYPLKTDPAIHGEFAEQATHPNLFDPRTDNNSRWEASYYQSLPDVEGVLMIGGGHATLIMGLMALANKKPIVSLATFGANAQEIWAMLHDKPWIETTDRQEQGRKKWNDDRAAVLVDSFARQRAKLDAIEREKTAVAEIQKLDLNRRAGWAMIYGVVATVLTTLGIFGSPTIFGEGLWLALYMLCFAAIPVCAGMSGAMLYTMRIMRKVVARPPSVREALAHGFWAGLGSALLFLVSQATSNPAITSFREAVIQEVRGLDFLLMFSLIIAFIAGLTYEAVFGKWEAVDASRSSVIQTGIQRD